MCAEASVCRTDDAIRGDLRVSAPSPMMASFNSMVCEFAARYPEVRVQMNYTSAYVDLRRDGYDAAVRAGPSIEPGLIARTLATDRAIAVASPAYLAAHGAPRTRRDLAQHRCLLGFTRGELPEAHWPWGKSGKVHVQGVLCTNDIALRAEAAVRGLGIAFLPEMMIRPILAEGALVPVLPGVLEQRARVAIVYPEREFVPPQVRAFVDAVVAWAPHALSVEGPERCAEEGRRVRRAR